MVADMAEEMLNAHGYDVCGIARTVAEALSLARHHLPDLAIIDLRLANGEFGTDVAAQLRGAKGLGVLYTSGNMAEVILSAAYGHACLSKPYHGVDLIRGLEIVADIAASGHATPPYPRKFQVLATTDVRARTSCHG